MTDPETAARAYLPPPTSPGETFRQSEALSRRLMLALVTVFVVAQVAQAVLIIRVDRRSEAAAEAEFVEAVKDCRQSQLVDLFRQLILSSPGVAAAEGEIAEVVDQLEALPPPPSCEDLKEPTVAEIDGRYAVGMLAGLLVLAVGPAAVSAVWARRADRLWGMSSRHRRAARTPADRMPRRLLLKDALNRAWRSFLQALAVEVLIAVLPKLLDALEGTDPVNWPGLWQSIPRVAGYAAVSYFWRRVLDRTKVPSAEPPTDAAVVEARPKPGPG